MRAPRNLPFLLKVYVIAGSVVLVTLALYYNHILVRRMHVQAESTTRLFSMFLAIELRDVQDLERQEFIRDVRHSINLPFVITDSNGRPMFWNRIGVEDIDELRRLVDFDPDEPSDPVLGRVLETARNFDRVNEPITIETEEASFVIHYGPSELASELAAAPYIQLAVFFIYLLFGFLGFRMLTISEQRSIWVGMAKEAAHQLGTPLSSIMGWISLMREEIDRSGATEKLTGAIDEAAEDVERLGRISARFSKIGSLPRLELQELVPIIEETIDYFERRRPSLKIHSTITLEVDELPLIRCSRDLLGWVFENLIKNSLDAIEDEGGKIQIRCIMNRNPDRLEIYFSDNGRGMSAGVRRRVFSPGFTTKSRGWGLGLALVKRIVEDIHHGAIKVLSSQVNRGTTFLISFPVV